MARIADVAAYFCANYPHKSELSKTRLTKLVYLADWESAKHTGKQLTNIKWYFHNYGPYVTDVVDAISSDKRFAIQGTLNHYGDPKMVIGLRDLDEKLNFSEAEKAILDKIIEDTKSMYWNSFIKHVYSTPPIASSDRYSELDFREFLSH